MQIKPSPTPRAVPKAIRTTKKPSQKKELKDIFAAHYLRSAYIWSFAKQ